MKPNLESRSQEILLHINVLGAFVNDRTVPLLSTLLNAKKRPNKSALLLEISKTIGAQASAFHKKACLPGTHFGFD